MSIKFVKRTGLKDSYLTLQQALDLAINNPRAIISVSGDCMENAGIDDGGTVAVDFTRRPRPDRKEDGKTVPGDPCLCYARIGSDAPARIMVKGFVGNTWLGPMVCTRYAQRPGKPIRINGGIPVIAILGVVYASWGRDGILKWEHDPSAYPTELSEELTVKAGEGLSAEDVFVRERDL